MKKRFAFTGIFFISISAYYLFIGFGLFPLLLFLGGSVLLLLGLFWYQHPLAKHKGIKKMLSAMYTLGVMFVGVAAMVVLAYPHSTPKPPPQNTTVIVLGCQVNGSEPSLMLRRRLDKAYEYLAANADIPAVLSGGLGEGKRYSEAEVMFRYLTARGIAPSRLYLEEHSTNTAENITNSYTIITAQGLSHDVVLVSDGFHLLRASIYAGGMELQPYPLPSNTPFYMVPYYTLREIPAIVVALFYT